MEFIKTPEQVKQEARDKSHELLTRSDWQCQSCRSVMRFTKFPEKGRWDNGTYGTYHIDFFDKPTPCCDKTGTWLSPVKKPIPPPPTLADDWKHLKRIFADLWATYVEAPAAKREEREVERLNRTITRLQIMNAALEARGVMDRTIIRELTQERRFQTYSRPQPMPPPPQPFEMHGYSTDRNDYPLGPSCSASRSRFLAQQTIDPTLTYTNFLERQFKRTHDTTMEELRRRYLYPDIYPPGSYRRYPSPF